MTVASTLAGCQAEHTKGNVVAPPAQASRARAPEPPAPREVEASPSHAPEPEPPSQVDLARSPVPFNPWLESCVEGLHGSVPSDWPVREVDHDPYLDFDDESALYLWSPATPIADVEFAAWILAAVEDDRYSYFYEDVYFERVPSNDLCTPWKSTGTPPSWRAIWRERIVKVDEADRQPPSMPGEPRSYVAEVPGYAVTVVSREEDATATLEALDACLAVCDGRH